jgi:hypothetical protein
LSADDPRCDDAMLDRIGVAIRTSFDLDGASVEVRA